MKGETMKGPRKKNAVGEAERNGSMSRRDVLASVCGFAAGTAAVCGTASLPVFADDVEVTLQDPELAAWLIVTMLPRFARSLMTVSAQVVGNQIVVTETIDFTTQMKSLLGLAPGMANYTRVKNLIGLMKLNLDNHG